MEPTDAQKSVSKTLRDTYGKDAVKPHAPDTATGVMRITLQAASCAHEWFFDTDGNLVNGSATLRLFDPPVVEHKPRNAIDN